MNKLFYLIPLFILMLNVVYAIDKPLNVQIPNCYNVTIDSELTQGNYTPISFKDCSMSGTHAFCDCRDKGTFNLTLQSDGSSLNSNDWRYYIFHVHAYQYVINESLGDLVVLDYGDRTYLKGNGIEYQGQNIVEVPNIIYQDRLVYVNVTKDIYIDRNITVIQYVENTSKIEEMNLIIINLNNSLNESQNNIKDSEIRNKVKDYWLWILGTIIGIIVLIHILNYAIVALKRI